jgi:hypothetical protein
MATATADKIAKLRRLYAGGATPGERAAAKAALDRMGVVAVESSGEQLGFNFSAHADFWNKQSREAQARQAQRERQEPEQFVELAYADSLERQIAIAACKRAGLIPRRRKAMPKGRRKPKADRWEKKIIARGPESKVQAAGKWYAETIETLRALTKAFKAGVADEAGEDYGRDISQWSDAFRSAYYSGYAASSGARDK